MSNYVRQHTVVLLVFVTVLLVATSIRAEDPTDRWAPVRFLLGTWEGGSASSVVTHTYELVLQDRFIQSRTRSEPRDAEGKESAQVHGDIGFFSYDPDRELIVFRQFLSEGYVNTYTLTTLEAPGDDLVFTSESTEGAGGMRARLTFRRTGSDAYEMLLDLASPGKEFFTCQHLVMHRVEPQ